MSFFGKEFDLVAVRIDSDFLICCIWFYFLSVLKLIAKSCATFFSWDYVNWQNCVMGLAHYILFLLNYGCAKLVVEFVMRL